MLKLLDGSETTEDAIRAACDAGIARLIWQGNIPGLMLGEQGRGTISFNEPVWLTEPTYDQAIRVAGGEFAKKEQKEQKNTGGNP